MSLQKEKQFGNYISRLIGKEDLSREEAKTAFYTLLNNETSEMQQGAFLAALTAKGETKEEVAGSWEAIFDLDTVKVMPQTTAPLVDNSGTGMDTFKTFNISTAASLVAVAGGVSMARHGARAITSSCGTVDMAETLGVDVECDAETVVRSIDQAGIGLFNGMSPKIHPMALGRILSNIHFGSTLNIAASLANPARPKLGVRGVYAKDRILPVINVMKAIGYSRALVLFGGIANSALGMDEASVCGTTHVAELKESGHIESYTILPTDFGLSIYPPAELSPSKSLKNEAFEFISLMKGNSTRIRKEVTILNAAMIFYVANKAETLQQGVNLATDILNHGLPYESLENWVSVQNKNPEQGLQKLYQLTRS